MVTTRCPHRLSRPHHHSSSERPCIRYSRWSRRGWQRLYGFRDILVLKVVKRLLDTGVSLQNIRAAVQHLRERGIDDLAQITLMGDDAGLVDAVDTGTAEDELARRRARRIG